MAKNIVVCCDGTGNEYGDCNSNVMKLFRMVIRDDVQQTGYYNPGLETLSSVPALTGPWWIAEYTPKKHYSRRKGAYELKIPAGERRQIPEGASIHPSVFARRDALSDYNPPNLPIDHVVAR